MNCNVDDFGTVVIDLKLAVDGPLVLELSESGSAIISFWGISDK